MVFTHVNIKSRKAIYWSSLDDEWFCWSGFSKPYYFAKKFIFYFSFKFDKVRKGYKIVVFELHEDNFIL